MFDSFSLAFALMLSAVMLPTTSAEPDKAEAKIELRVGKDGSILYREENVSLADLATKLKDVENKAGTTVFLECHPDVLFREVDVIIRRLQEVGFEKFTLRARK